MRYYMRLLSFLSRPKVISILLWIVGASYADTFIRNGIRKFDAEGFWSHSFLETWGFPLCFMYFIGVVEVVRGLFLLLPKLRLIGSLVLAIVMVGALSTRSIFGFINGVEGENFYAVIRNLDLVFFFSTIAIFLFFATYGRTQSTSISD